MHKAIGMLELVSEIFTGYGKNMIRKVCNYLYTGNKVYLA
jgi:hypothetical protein